MRRSITETGGHGLLAFALLLGRAFGPAEDGCPAHLFIIERSKNANIVVYDANRNRDGGIASSEPVVAYWLLNGETGQREALNVVEWQSAYGFDVKPAEARGTFVMTFKAGSKRHLTIGTLNGCPAATAQIGDHEGILRRIFVKSKEGGLRPKVEYVELFGDDVTTGGALYEKFVPEK